MSATEPAPLLVTLSGIRGIAGVSLTREVVLKYVNSFAELQRPQIETVKSRTIVLGRDSRISGPEISKEVIAVLLAAGYDVLDCGIVPTPTVQFTVQTHKAVGGIIVTSSHNPKPWNGLKFVDSDGLFLSPEKCEVMFAYADAHPITSPVTSSTTSSGHLETLPVNAAAFAHVDAVLKLPYISPERVAKQKFRVCLDTVCGAGGPTMTYLLKKLGCDVIELNTEPTGDFPHTPEPIPENLTDLCKAVVEHKADMGIAVDPDVDRCVLIGEDGKPLVEEYTLAIAVKFMLGDVGRRGVVCKNLSSSRANDDIAASYGCTLVPAAVGEINVAKKMVELNAVIGGEGNGGVMLPDVHIGRDAPVAATLVLQCLTNARERDASHVCSISELKKSLPQYEIVKLKTSITGIDANKAIEEIKKKMLADKDMKVNTIDGLHVSGKDWWVHLRKSNTEPIIRVIGEAPTAAQAKEHCERFMKEIQTYRL